MGETGAVAVEAVRRGSSRRGRAVAPPGITDKGLCRRAAASCDPGKERIIGE